MSRTLAKPTKACRGTIFAKIRFLSTVVGHMGEMFDKGVMDDEDLYAISMFMSDIAKEVYPEHYADKEGAA